MIPESMVVYWMMIFWLKQSDNVNGGLLNDDTLIKTKGYLEIKTKWYLCQCGLLYDILIKTMIPLIKD